MDSHHREGREMSLLEWWVREGAHQFVIEVEDDDCVWVIDTRNRGSKYIDAFDSVEEAVERAREMAG